MDGVSIDVGGGGDLGGEGVGVNESKCGDDCPLSLVCLIVSSALVKSITDASKFCLVLLTCSIT